MNPEAPSPISIVTDSTADIPDEIAKDNNISVIPAAVSFGETSYYDRIDLTMTKFLELLSQSETLPTTAAPPLVTYTNVYNNTEHPQIISIHVGSKFSGIFNAALAAANEIDRPIKQFEGYDSGTVSIGLGNLAIEAARLRDSGVSLASIMKKLDDIKERTHVFAILDTLKYLEKGGRASHLQRVLGSMLQIKPMLSVMHNTIASEGNTRTRKKAISGLIQKTLSLGPLEKLSVMHADAEKEAIQVADTLSTSYHGEILLVEIGPVVATHTGPGAIGIAAVTVSQNN